MNERIYKNRSENNKASFTWHAAKFGSDSYIGQNAHNCLRSFKHERLYTSTRKLHLKCRLMSENGVYKINKFLKV